MRCVQTPLPSVGTQASSGTTATSKPAADRLELPVGDGLSRRYRPRRRARPHDRQQKIEARRHGDREALEEVVVASTATASERLGSQSIPWVTRIGVVGADGEAADLDERVDRAGVERAERHAGRRPVPPTVTSVPSCEASTRQIDAPFAPKNDVQPMLDCGVIAAAT